MILYLLHDTWLKSSDLSVLAEDISQFPAFDLSSPNKSGEWKAPIWQKKGLREKVNLGDHNLAINQMIHIYPIACFRNGIWKIATGCHLLQGARFKAWALRRGRVVEEVPGHETTCPSIGKMRGREDISFAENDKYEGLIHLSPSLSSWNCLPTIHWRFEIRQNMIWDKIMGLKSLLFGFSRKVGPITSVSTLTTFSCSPKRLAQSHQ